MSRMSAQTRTLETEIQVCLIPSILKLNPRMELASQVLREAVAEHESAQTRSRKFGHDVLYRAAMMEGYSRYPLIVAAAPLIVVLAQLLVKEAAGMQ